jgi:hypothetical protein
MAFSQLQAGSAATGSGSVTPAMTSNSTAGTLLVATLFTVAGTGFTPPGRGWRLAAYAVSGTADRAEIWYYPNNPGGIGAGGAAPVFTGPSGVNCRGCLAEYQVGAGNGQVLDVTGAASGTGPATSLPVSTSPANAAGDLGIVAFGNAFSVNASGSWTLPGGWSSTHALATGTTNTWASYCQTGLAATTQSVTGQYSPDTNQTGWTAVVAIFREVTPVVITTASLPGGSPGTPYSQALAASGGVPPYTWTVTSGTLPTPAAAASGTNAATYDTMTGDGVTGLTSCIAYNDFDAGTGTAAAATVSGSGGSWTVSGSAPPVGVPGFLSGNSVGGFSNGTTYWVVSSSGSTFRLSATAGGSPISPSSAGSATFTPYTGVPPSWAANTNATQLAEVAALPGGIPVVNFKPIIPLLLAGTLDVPLTAYFGGAPDGAILLPWHEPNDPQFVGMFTAAQMEAADAYLLVLAHSVNPTLKVGRCLATLTGGTNVLAWIWPGMDCYGLDGYQKTGLTETPEELFANALNGIRAVSDAPIAIIETNTPDSLDPWWGLIQDYAAANGITRVQSYWGTTGTGGQAFESGFAARMNDAVTALAGGVALSPSGTISGTPDADGVFSFEIQVADSASQVATAALSVTIAPSSIASWSNSYAASNAASTPLAPGAASCAVEVANTAGDWMLAIVTWRQASAGDGVTVSVADDAHNWWEPAGAPTGDSSAAGVTRTAIWAAPAARAANFVLAAPTGFVLALAVLVIDVPGIEPWMSVTGVDPGYANAATSLSLSLAAPGSQAFLIAAAGTDDNADTVTGPGAAWSALPAVTASNGADHTADLALTAGWQLTTGAATATWSSTGALDLSGVLAGVLVAAASPAQPNPGWPVVITEIAAGYGALTPPSELAWADASAYQRALTVTQGRQYTLGQLQAGQGTMTFDNQGGAFIPPGSGAFAGIDSGTPGRVRLINPAALCPHNVIWAGPFQRWPPGWDGVLRGVTQATISDAWAYVNTTLPTILRAEIQDDEPYAYWPLSDTAGSAQASNIAQGGSGLPLTVVTSKYGTGTATQEFGTNGGVLPGDTTVTVETSGQTSSSTGMWEQALAGTSAGTNGYGYTLQCQDSGFPAIGSGLTIECFVEPQDFTSPWDLVLWVIKDGRGPVLQASLSHATGHVLLTWWNTNGAQEGPITVSTSGLTSLGLPVHVAVAFDQASYAVYVDGGVLPGASGTFGGTGLRPSFQLISFNGQADRFAAGGMWTGYVAHAAIFPAMLPQIRSLTHWFAAFTAVTDDTAAGRMERLLQPSGWTGRRCILPESGPDIDQMVSCSDIAGQPAATSLTNVAASTLPAVLAVAPTGDVYYLAKQYAYNQPIRWALGDDVAAGEIPFLPLGAGSGLDYDPSRVVDDIQITHLDRQDVILPTGMGAVQAAASQKQYGDITYWVTGYLDGDATKPYTYGPGLYDLANWVAGVFGKPRLRAARLAVECFANSANTDIPDSPVLAWQFFGAAAVGDMVQVNIRPVTDSPLVIAITGRISQTERTLKNGEDGQVAATLTLVIDPAPEASALTCDDPVRGQLNGTNVLAW